jgi:hypothetical protein
MACLAPSAEGQDGKIMGTWGPELVEQKGNDLLEVFGWSGDFFYALYIEGRKREQFIIEKIAIDSLKPIAARSFTLPVINKLQPLYAYPISLRNKSYIIATAEDPEGSDFYVMAFAILDDLQISPNPVILDIGNKNAVKAENGFLLEVNEAKTHLTLLLPEEHLVDRNEKFTLRHFDANMRLEFTKKLEIPYRSASVTLLDMILSNTGTLYGLISIDEKGIPNGEAGFSGKEFSLLSYRIQDESVQEKSLSLGNKWLYDVRMTTPSDTSLQLVGFYSNMVNMSLAGTFSVLLDTRSGDLLKQGLSPFDRDFRSLFRSNIRSGESDLSRFKLDHIQTKSDGITQLISEKRYIETSTVFNPATGTYSVIDIYNYDEVLVTGIHPSSAIAYNLVVPKYQSSTRSIGRYASYIASQKGNKTYLIYNDHEKNIPIDPNNDDLRNLSNLNNARPVMAEISPEGELRRAPIDFRQAPEFTLDTRHFYQSEKAVVLLTYNSYRIRFLKLSLD